MSFLSFHFSLPTFNFCLIITPVLLVRPTPVPRHPSLVTPRAFTLVELLVVISIIIVLMGLLFPAFKGVQDQAKKTQAKNDMSQIVTAVTAFYTEYGKYPLPTNQGGESYTYAGDNDQLFNGLRGNDTGQNPRSIPFVTLPTAKDFSQPRGGLGGDGKFYDPYGMPYNIRIDADYNNKIDNPYQNAGFATIDAGVIAYSSGKNKTKENDTHAADFDDVLSWQ